MVPSSVICVLLLCFVAGYAKGNDLKLVVAGSNNVTVYHATNMSVYGTVTQLETNAKKIAYHKEHNLLFMETDNYIYNASLDFLSSIEHTMAGNIIKEKNICNCSGLAVDWVHNKIYFSDCFEKAELIKVMDLDGSNTTIVVAFIENTEIYTYTVRVDPYQGLLFWTRFLFSSKKRIGILEVCNTSKSTDYKKISGSSEVGPIFALDIKTQKIYYTLYIASEDLFSLASMNYNGEDKQEHFSVPQLHNLYGLDIYNGYIYWNNFALSFSDSIYKAPVLLSQGRVQLLKTFDSSDMFVYDILLLPPDFNHQMNNNFIPENENVIHRNTTVGAEKVAVCPGWWGVIVAALVTALVVATLTVIVMLKLAPKGVYRIPRVLYRESTMSS